jgi:hypothetical protein
MILQFFIDILPRLQRGIFLVAHYQKLRIWLISARVADAESRRLPVRKRTFDATAEQDPHRHDAVKPRREPSQT